ncbi:hypothetical protein ACQP2X_21300 [Actinoplanes sp. CA-131856]
MKPGEVWHSTLDPSWPVLLLSEDLHAIQIVAPATEDQKRGYVMLSADEAAPTRPSGLAGIEVPLDIPGGGVIRVALPHQDHIFCTWRVSLTPADLTAYVGTLPSANFRQVELALRRSGG